MLEFKASRARLNGRPFLRKISKEVFLKERVLFYRALSIRAKMINGTNLSNLSLRASSPQVTDLANPVKIYVADFDEGPTTCSF